MGSASRLLRVRQGELVPMLWSAAFFFCLLTGYFILRPVRETFGIEVGAEVYKYLWTGTAIGTLLATPIYGYLVSRFPRRGFVPLVYGIAIVCIVAFHAAYLVVSGDARIGVGYAFYIWLSVFNLFATAVFWGFMVDLWGEHQGKRLFGLIAAGGTLGAIFGGLQVRWLAAPLGTHNLLAVAVVYYLLAIACAVRLSRLFGPGTAEQRQTQRPLRVGLAQSLNGVALFFRSRYLLAIGVYLVLITLMASVIYVEKGELVSASFPTRGVADDIASQNRSDRTEFFALLDIGYNVIALLIQILLTGRLISWLGIGAMLAVVPAVNMVGFGALALWPGLVVLGVFEICQKGARYAVMKPAREVLFTVLDREQKYKAKAFIDTTVFRSSDVAWIWIQDGLRTWLGAFALKLYVVVPLCLGWAAVGRSLGAAQGRRSSESGSLSSPHSV